MYKRMRCNTKGFSLIEVIVVAVIVAILAAVAIPLYSGYVDRSRQGTVDQLAQAAAAAADGFYRKTGAVPTEGDLNLFYDQTKYTVTISPTNVSVEMIEHAGFTKSVPYK